MSGATPLYIATERARRGRARALDAGADKDLASRRDPAHHRGAEARAIVRTLLDSGADKDLARNDGGTPLHMAAGGQGRVARAPAPTRTSRRTTAPPAVHRARAGHDAVVRMLLDAGADKDLAAREATRRAWRPTRPSRRQRQRCSTPRADKDRALQTTASPRCSSRRTSNATCAAARRRR